MNITLTGIKIVQDNKFLAFEKNSGVDVINITVDTDDEWTYKLDVKYPDKCCSGEALYNIINLTRTGNVCTAILTSDMLPFAGKYTMQLRGINGDKVAHSDTFDAWVKYSIEPGSTYDPVPSEFYQIEENITEMNNNPPYPSDDGYWMIWDVNTRVYKKSDIKIINGLPEISESTKDMALYNDGEKAEWREQRNPIPDWQENDPESPNYIRNRNGGYYTWDEENPIGKILSSHQSVLHFSDGAPDGQTPCYIVVMRGTNKTEFFKHFEYLFGSGNADELGFRLTNWASVYNGYYIAYAPSGADITDIKVYAATPVAFPLELTELQLATQRTAGLVKVGVEWEDAAELFGHAPITMHLPEGKIEALKPWVQVPSFEYSESGGMVPQNVAPAYAQNGFVVESSNYLAGILGIFSTDFPIQIVGASMVYGSGYYPYCPCQFFTKTGKSGYFDWRVTGKAENAVLNPYIRDKYAVSDTRMSTSPVGYASRDEKYATVQTPFTVWDSYDGTFRFSLSPGYGLIINQSDFFKTGLGLTDTDFPITLTCMNSEYPGSYTQYPRLSFFLSTATGVTGTFALKQLNDSSTCENVNLHRSASGDSDLLIVRFTQDGDTWSADKTYAEMKQALDDGKTVQGVASDITAIGYVSGDNIVFHFSLFHSENEQNRYFMYNAIEFIVSEDGIKAFSNNDDLMSSYRCVILPAQTLLVTNNDGALSAKMIGPVEPLENPLTYLFNAFGLSSEYTIPTLTALYDTVPGSFTAERFYFSNAVLTPNSDNASAKIDFIFKSADATKTLTGSVTMTKGWDGETPLDETWTYEEKDLLDGAVRYDETQSLTGAQKQQARDNIGVVDIPAPSADNVGMVPVAALADEDENTYGYEMKALADPRVTIFHVTGKGTTAEPYAMDITLEELTAAINAGNAVFATLDSRTFVAGETAAQNLIFQYQNTRTYATKTPQGSQYVFSTIDAPRTDNTYIRIPLMMVDTSTGSIAMNSIPTMLSIYSVLLYKGTDGAWKSSKTVHQIGDAMNSFCVLRMTDPDKRRYICTKNVYNNNANDLVECVCREGNTLYTATITESGVTMTEETLLPVSSDGTSFVLNSSTEGSTKRFKITVDDSGTLTAAEVTDETADA